MTYEPTKQDLIWASSHYLSEPLPLNYDQWSDGKLDRFIKYNAWEPFENLGADYIWEQIEQLAWSVREYINERRQHET